MDKNTKTILIIVGSIGMLCLCMTAVLLTTAYGLFNRSSASAEEIFSTDPDKAIQVGSEIADFVVPSGFGSPNGIHFLDVTLIRYKSQDEQSHLVLAQFPAGTSIDLDEMVQQIKAVPGEPSFILFSLETTPIEQKKIKIQGKESTLFINQGINLDGISYHTAMATFQGRGGPSLLMFAVPSDEWDIEVVENFALSIQ